MPRKPRHPCAWPGCPNLTDARYCEEHKRGAEKQYDRYGRAPDAAKRYNRAWKRIRDRYITEHPLCEDCLEQDRIVPAAEVHHVVPLSRGGTSDTRNLRALCRSCHQKRHIDIGDRRPFK